ncbi:MAG TPA: hypothetical protein VJ810_21825 [Blastocatellia bacterium]|nr:hypothetical protein [Blastocatellia bacterium]
MADNSADWDFFLAHAGADKEIAEEVDRLETNVRALLRDYTRIIESRRHCSYRKAVSERFLDKPRPHLSSI